MPRTWMVAGALIAALALAAAGCDDEVTYDCETTMDKMYDEDCELWCWIDSGGTLYLDQCGWFDDGDPANFSESEAEEICDELEDMSEDEECMGEFEDMLKCLYKGADDCAEDCDDEFEDMVDCIF